MIVFNLEKLEDFMYSLPRNITKEVFFYIDEESTHPEFHQSEETRLILHFLGKINEQLTGLYQTRLTFPKSLKKDKIYTEMKKVFEEQGDIKLISGKISEIYYSIS